MDFNSQLLFKFPLSCVIIIKTIKKSVKLLLLKQKCGRKLSSTFFFYFKNIFSTGFIQT